MDSRPHALALLPERQAHYDGCCATLNRAIAAGKPTTVYSTQQSLCYALASLNRTRAAAGLSAIPTPKLLSFDEVLQLGDKECTSCGGLGCASCHGGKAAKSTPVPCGGCGAEHPNDRCLGCRHDFEVLGSWDGKEHADA